ncbi:MAG: hypothetical protein IIA90_04505 [Chloroflexi bacterium]|nr:hypothetical protein [Chloroflexota bacterium]
MNKRDDRAREDNAKADEMAARADVIERQADNTIYSDDPDAIEALEARIAGLEAERDAIKAYNASCRKGAPDVDLLTDSQRRDLANVKQVAAYSLGKGGAMPSYALTNLSGNISRQKKRLGSLRNPRPELPRLLNPVKYAGECRTCGQTIERGESALYWKAAKELEHDACYQRGEAIVTSGFGSSWRHSGEITRRASAPRTPAPGPQGPSRARWSSFCASCSSGS